jgi:hypothetical protein
MVIGTGANVLCRCWLIGRLIPDADGWCWHKTGITFDWHISTAHLGQPTITGCLCERAKTNGLVDLH